GLHLSLFRQRYRLRLADGITDVALLVQPIQSVPIVALPCCGTELVVATSQVEEGEYCVVNFVGIDFHRGPLSGHLLPGPKYAMSRRKGVRNRCLRFQIVAGMSATAPGSAWIP